MLLRNDEDRKGTRIGWVLAAAIGVIAALLVIAGNPANMGLCGACFLRDLAGALGFTQGKAPAIFRPELAGVVLGACLVSCFRSRFQARSGGFAGLRFALGIIMGIAALVFLGCPFRMMQRLAGGDLTAWIPLPAFVLGVAVASQFERRGYSIGKTQPAPRIVGAVGPLIFAGLTAAFVAGELGGPGPDASTGPPRAPWLVALGASLVAGVLLSTTGFCVVSAARQITSKPKGMLIGALCLMGSFALMLTAAGRLNPGELGQVAAHTDYVASSLALFVLGWAGALAGGCPVRQLVQTGEGNADALMAVVGILVGATLAHNLGAASAAMSKDAAGGATSSGIAWMAASLIFCAVVSLTMTAKSETASKAR